MSSDNPSWEHKLVILAREGLDRPEPQSRPAALRPALLAAYRHCDALTRQHSATFHLASALMPLPKRRAIRALYGFCRTTDDLVDDAPAAVGAPAALAAWRERALAPHPPDDDPVALAWADTRARYRIPLRYAEQLIEGVAADLGVVRYATFDDLAAYCYGVASTVGLMSMHIIGFSGPEALPYAVKLGVALQLTNILRDVAEDWRMGRLYLPLDELAAYGLAEADIARLTPAPRPPIPAAWRAFIAFQIARNRQLYAEAMPGIRLLHPDGRFAIAAAAELYRGILDDIEAHGGDVFSRRAHLSTQDKLRRLPGIWRRSRQR